MERHPGRRVGELRGLTSHLSVVSNKEREFKDS